MTQILVVDDDVHIRKLICKALEKSGFEALGAADGKEAIIQFGTHRPEMVITDIIMPDMEGTETITQLRQMDPDVKIIAISGGGFVQPEFYLGLAKKMGADQIIRKPIDLHEMMDKIEALLSPGKNTTS